MTDETDIPRVDVPPRPDLPREKPTPSKWRHVAFVVASFVIALLATNEYASRYLGRYTSNRGYWIVHQKWELLEAQEEPVDWLILGDSSCNQGVMPQEWDKLTGGRSINLCSIGNMVTIDDAWMLERYIERHGPPKNVLIMHVYDMWHRDLNNALLGQIPLGYGFWNRFDPAVELTFDEWKSVVASRYLPLYSQNTSLKDAARKGLEQMSWEAPFKRDFVMDEQGFMPWYTAYPRGVRGDVGGHLRFLRKSQFAMSADTRDGLRAIGELADEHKIAVHFVPSPVAQQLGRNPGFKKYRKALDTELGEFADAHDTVTHHPTVYQYPDGQMENADHVVFSAAKDLTRKLARDVAGVDFTKLASDETLTPKGAKSAKKVGNANAWKFGPETPGVTIDDAELRLLAGLSIQVPIRLESRPKDRVAVVSRWSTNDDQRSLELGVNHLQQPYLAISPDGAWNGKTLMLVAEQQLRLGEDAVLSASLTPGKSAAIWINGERVASQNRNIPASAHESDLPVVIGNRAIGSKSFAIDAAIGAPRITGRPLVARDAPKLAQQVGVSRKAAQFAKPTPLTKPPGHHWFGYYDKHQFSADGKRLLVMKTPFEGRKPKADDVIEIGYLDLENDNAWTKIGESRAWSWQQGCMLQWRPEHPGEVLWNDREDKRFVTRVYDLETGSTRTLDRPIYHVASDGKSAVSADFARIQHMRPGYGYPGVPDPNGDKLTPPDRPIELVNLDTGAVTPLVDYSDFVPVKGPRANPKEGAKHYVNHLQFSPSGERVFFLHRWRPKGRGGFATRVFTVKRDGSDLRLLTDDGGLSHYTWRDDRSVLIWASQHRGYALYDIEKGFQKVVLEMENGHQSYVPGTNNRFLVTDTYPGDDGKQTLLLYDIEGDEIFVVARFPTRRRDRGEFRTDLHPRLSRDGSKVVVDSSHRGGRQQYLVDIAPFLGRAPTQSK